MGTGNGVMKTDATALNKRRWITVQGGTRIRVPRVARFVCYSANRLVLTIGPERGKSLTQAELTTAFF